MNNNEKPGDEDNGNEFTDQQSNVLADNTHGSDSLFASSSNHSTMKKAKVEVTTPNVGGFIGMAGDSNMIPMGSMLYPPTFNPNFDAAFVAGLSASNNNGSSQPMQMGYHHPGTSPSFHAMGHANQYLYGYPNFAVTNPHLSNGGVGHTPDASSNHDGGDGGQQRISGMTPLMFAGIPSINHMTHVPSRQEGNNFHPAVLQVVSADSQAENSSQVAQASLVPFGNVTSLQQPKKWVRWSDHEDQILTRAVDQWGENNFRYVSEQIFHGSRSEVQCKNRWKKALQPGLVKGRWTKEEDNIIIDCVNSGNEKWSDIARRLPGRIGEQIKEHWMNVLDPDVKKGIWTAGEMKILRDSQKELGNKWSDIAKRIPGRSENSVKNRWYNQKTSDRRAQRKRELATPEPSESERDAMEQHHLASNIMHGRQQHQEIGQNDLYDSDTDSDEDLPML